ncbi:hypothetical protein V6N12_031901 [Hibiscus sabdariffa]|uniref:DUF3741 domain-containing protein n=1 Tax=Hibiscus sabdariffa TaxID=183260 RepID=A0ABR2BYH3_9ROSI
MSNTERCSSGCFSSLLRRILCSGTPQTHPSDQVVGLKLNTRDEVAEVQVPASESGPGVVARLMGLDSLPENTNWLHKAKIPGPVTRSRSVNFMDYMLEFDLTQAKHRRVKTSSSFREVPHGPQLFQHNQKQEFLLVYLDNEVKSNETVGFKPRKSEKGNGSGTKQATQKDNVREKVACKKQIREKNNKISKLKNEPRARGVSGKHSKEVPVVTSKKKKNQRPVKKIDFSEHPFSVQHANDGIREDSRSLELKSKKKCTSKSVKQDSPTTDINARIPVAESTDMEETEHYTELIDKLSKLTEEDTKFANWKTKQVFTFEEICAEFGEQILKVMLHQVADELCLISNDM